MHPKLLLNKSLNYPLSKLETTVCNCWALLGNFLENIVSSPILYDDDDGRRQEMKEEFS